ncbi:hypothetical protein [Meiothermus sp.]|uniref:hypothetical protein n=1 Tax=Meiothermus sp. TaxID=1955249 RepID=UPI0021DBADA8|nr:hypothetical protein [Meiothermus sp.]GIW33754.1 MAG: hypothetical protein KatS3mg072_1087 [Meiothermus sp.]
MHIAVIFGYPAIYTDGTLYWFCHKRDHQATELVRQLADLLRAVLVVVDYMPGIEREAMAAWAIRQIDQLRSSDMPVEQWWALEDCRINLWQMHRRNHVAANA